jgi:hypothetical protein
LKAGEFKIMMTLRKLLLPALALLLLSSAGMRRAAQGQTSSSGLSGSWVGVVTLPPPLDNGAGGNTLPIMLSFNSNGTVTFVVPNNGNGNDRVAVGSWVSTADGQFAVTTNQFQYDNNGNYKRTDRIRISLSVSGNQMSGNAEYVVFDGSGVVVPGLTFTGSPIAVETIGSM